MIDTDTPVVWLSTEIQDIAQRKLQRIKREQYWCPDHSLQCALLRIRSAFPLSSIRDDNFGPVFTFLENLIFLNFFIFSSLKNFKKLLPSRCDLGQSFCEVSYLCIPTPILSSRWRATLLGAGTAPAAPRIAEGVIASAARTISPLRTLPCAGLSPPAGWTARDRGIYAR